MMAVIVLAITAVCFVATPSLYWRRARGYLPHISQAAQQYGLDAALVLAVANVESRFEPCAVSKAGAVGMMQLMPDTARWICAQLGEPYMPENLTDAKCNVRWGCWYLRYLFDRFDLPWALAAYNAGEGMVRRWIAEGRNVDGIPYAETARYVKDVQALHARYQRRLRYCS